MSGILAHIWKEGNKICNKILQLNLYIVGRGFLTPPNFKRSCYFVNYPNFKSRPHPHHSDTPNYLFPLLALFVDLFLWLNGWSCHIWCVILLNDIMSLQMSNLGTLLPDEPCCVFYTTRVIRNGKITWKHESYLA